MRKVENKQSVDPPKLGNLPRNMEWLPKSVKKLLESVKIIPRLESGNPQGETTHENGYFDHS